MTSIDNQTIRHIALFPNPATSWFVVEGLDNTTTVAVFDIAGKKVAEKTVQPNEKISVAGWNKGAYLVNVNGKTAKLVVK